MQIGVTGPAGAGKDTVAHILATMFDYEKVAFAGPLKAMLAAAGLPEPGDRALKEQIIPGFDFSWRQAAQTLGTEWGRGLDSEIWTKLTKLEVLKKARMRLREPESLKVVYTDVRFDNEAKMIRDMGGQIWHLNGRRADLGANAGHASEKGVLFNPCCDFHIDNSGDMQALESRVWNLMARFSMKGR